MILGLARLPANRFGGPVLCLSGGQDRVISNRTSIAIASYYGARHEVFSGRGHWLIAASAAREIAGRVLRWLEEGLLRSMASVARKGGQAEQTKIDHQLIDQR
jgi:pimeloyl-ACP methyl ester carboxylesterase